MHLNKARTRKIDAQFRVNYMRIDTLFTLFVNDIFYIHVTVLYVFSLFLNNFPWNSFK